jgi:hypothetical protein
MSPQDTQMLNDFLAQLVQARGIQKDTEADALIQRAVAQQPDAAYLLVQRSLLQEQALNNAKDRIAALENQVRSGQGGGGDGKFLDANTWGNSGARSGQAPAQYQRDDRDYQRDYQPPYQSQPPQYQQPGQSPGFLRRAFGGGGGGFGGSSMLGSIAATAAGVAAGSFLFHGLDNMFHDHNQGGGSNHLLNSDDPGNNLFSDQSGSGLADQAGLGDVGQSVDNGSSQGLFDSGADEGGLDGGSGGFFDGDGSDEGLFS